MALLIPGHWAYNAFPDSHFDPNHWPHHGTGVGGPSLIAGHWADNAFPDGHFDPNHWLHYGAGVGGPSLIPGHWADNAFPDGHFDPNHWLHYGAAFLPGPGPVPSGGSGGWVVGYPRSDREVPERRPPWNDDDEVLILLN